MPQLAEPAGGEGPCRASWYPACCFAIPVWAPSGAVEPSQECIDLNRRGPNVRTPTLRRRRRTLTAAAAASAALAMLALWPAVGVPPNEPTATDAPQNVNWRFYGNDLANTRYQDIDQINPSSVADLEPAWVFRTGVLDPAAKFENSPIVVDGTMYVSTGHDDVFALDAATGEQKWAYHPAADMPPLDQLSICCGRDSRGVAYGDGLIFVARLDAKLVALDAQTGEEVWKATVADWRDGHAMTLAPQYADGTVIVGLSGGEFRTRGAAVAYDARTGRREWTFRTTLPGSTWEADSWRTGGAPVWTTPAVDPDHGLVYLTTGNASPDLNGEDREGKNLYTASLLGLDLQTGHVRWAFQEVHHDIWDYDGPQVPVLFDLTRDGRTYPAVSHCNKNGEHYILNRVTGQPLFPVEEVPVPTEPAWQHPWPTQPVSSVERLTPITVGPVPDGITTAPRYTPPQEQPLAMAPGVSGGCQWPPAAYSPRTGYVYYAANYAPQIFHSFPGNDSDFGSDIDPIPGVENYTVVGATDTSTGKVVWSTRAARGDIGMAVAGDLLFYPESTREFHAVDARTGEPLWTFDASTVPGAGVPSAPAAVYAVDGREYVVEAFGSRGAGAGDAVIAFALPR
jgi:quinohemoprotein ethanol dehydrogenase